MPPGGFPVNDADEFAGLVRDYDAVFGAMVSIGKRLRALQARAISATIAAGPEHSPPLISLAQAAQRARLSKTRMRAMCSKRLYGTPAGFGYKIAGRWHVVDEEPFRDWLQGRERLSGDRLSGSSV
jgi:hypothetical protein